MRSMLMITLLWTSPVQAQADLRVVLLGAPTDPSWVRSLRTELDAEGSELIGEVSPERVQDATQAQVRAQDAGADAAVWIDSESGVVQIHALVVGAPGELEAELDPGRDSRTVALVVVSLLDEAVDSARQPRASGAQARVVQAGPLSAGLTAPLAHAPAGTPRYDSWIVEDGIGSEASRTAEPREGQDTSSESADSLVYVGFGVGVFTLASDIAVDLGGYLQTVVGVRVGDLVRLQANLEGGVFNERLGEFPEAQPFARLCPEAALAPRVGDSIRLWVGAHACLGFAEAKHHAHLDPWAPWDLTEGLVATAAAGGFVALEISIVDGRNLWIRADLDGTTTVNVARQPDVMAGLSTTLELF